MGLLKATEKITPNAKMDGFVSSTSAVRRFLKFYPSTVNEVVNN
jgi:hypothetical protein